MLLILGAAVVLALINTFVTVTVARSTVYERTQKLFQFLLIWLVPVVGAAISWYVTWQVIREEARSPFGSNDIGNEYLHYNYPDPREEHSGHDSGHHGGGDGGH